MRLDKYAVRRAVAITVLALLSWVGVEAFQALTYQPSYSCAVTFVEVDKGDTAWDIAHEYCEGDVVAVVDLLVAMYGARLDTWQVIHLPRPTVD